MADVIFRVDATSETGGGHLSRCVSLALACNKLGLKTEFICNSETRTIANKVLELHDITFTFFPGEFSVARDTDDLMSSSIEYQNWDAQSVIDILKDRTEQTRWLVVDSYRLDFIFERKMRAMVNKICVIEDLQSQNHDCDLLIDQNWINTAAGYYENRLPPSCKLLLGPEYALLNASLVDVGRKNNATSELTNILIYFGDADAHNQTEFVLNTIDCSHFEGMKANVVLGWTNKHAATVRSKFQRPRHIEIEFFQSSSDFFDLMKSSDIAIGAGGTTVWERMFIGLPAIVISTADNQERSCLGLHREGLIIYLGTWLEVDQSKLRTAIFNAIQSPTLLSSISSRGKKLIDGHGALRAAKSIVTIGLQ